MNEARIGPLGRIKWSAEMNDYFKKIVPGRTKEEIIDLFYKKFEIRLTDCAYKNRKQSLKVKSGIPGGRFEKGHVPHNKGKPQKEWLTSNKSKDTRFKKGNLPSMAKPLGVERVNRDGYIEVHIAERPIKHNDNWKFKHRIVYEKHYGQVPTGHNLVFADGNKRNFDPKNIVAVPKSLWVIINNCHIPYHDSETLQIAIDIAKLKKAVNDAEKHPRPCKKCGLIFKPRYPHQRTCDKCLGRKQ